MYLSNFIESGLAFCSLIDLWKKDNNHIRNGGKIYYAVDTGIVKMYSDVENNYNYAKIFPDDDVNSLKALIRAVGLYIFENQKNRNPPLLLLPPHNKELKGIIYAIMMKVVDEKFSFASNANQIKAIFNDYSINKNDAFLIDNLRERVLDLICFLFDDNRSFAAELSKITSLLSKNKVVALRSYADDDIPDLYDTTNSSHYDTLRGSSAKWRDLLKGHAPDKDDDKLCIDAEVLARLEYINSQFSLDRSKGSKLLLLITGDSSIHKATKSYRIDSGEIFYDLYIRDPKVFLAAPDLFYTKRNIFNDSVVEGNNSADLVYVSLSGITHCIEQHPECQVDICNKINDVNKIKEVRNKWNEYVKENLLNYTFKQEDILEKMKELINVNSFQEIEKKIDKKIATIWIDCWKLSAQVGYWAVKEIERSQCGDYHIANRERLFPLRSIPALKLTYPSAMGVVYDLFKELFHERIINSQKIFKKLEKEDPSDYTAFLIYALAFGAAGKWRVSCILSNIALTIADDPSYEKLRISEKMHEPIKGDEAAYVLAWSTRHTSENIHSLKKAKEYIDDAKRRKIEASGNGSDLRYECESIAIDVASNMYYLFLPEEIDLQIEGYSCDKGLNELKNRLKSIIDDVGEIEKIGKISLQGQLISLMIFRQSITYYYFVIIILYFKCGSPICQEDNDFSENHLETFKRILDTPEYKVKSFMNYVIYLLSVLLFKNNDEKEDIQKELIKLLNRDQIGFYCVMPYDKELYKFFESLVREYRRS